MSDTIETFGHSLLQHGKEGNRIYLMKFDKRDEKVLLKYLDTLANKENYTKIVAKLPFSHKNSFKDYGYEQEAVMPSYYQRHQDCVMMSKYLTEDRAKIQNASKLEKIIQSVQKKAGEPPSALPGLWRLRRLTENDVPALAQIYQTVFQSYPFPIFDEQYLLETMADNIQYYGVFTSDGLVAVASSETDPAHLNSEMTDFAVLSEYRGYQLALHLLLELEQQMKQQGYRLLYTIARSLSYGMNSTFAKAGYSFGGTLFNNTQISGSIESMNIWHKEI
ncbi:putative beta-lysine N-acetyltransferase [Acetobacterium paludosum]|uniref:Beta-lysine N-acetyltransferase n=1 Tax=Acetobacterium paludosum TaxID=52693 RepID=A0A923I1U2_9FIRM|nr:putative beta-lysine N-acetyltransferase [Acetobacterium paludosum]MBC3887535.1 putative beta-lysine N-acetyltransferase [Acetobacterium paludosum]